MTATVNNILMNIYYYLSHYLKTQIKLEGKYSLESTDPRESEIRAPYSNNHCPQAVLLLIYYRKTI